MRSTSALFVIAATTMLLFAGCNQRPPTAPVTGVVTYKGKPLTHGSIMFQPDAGPPGRSVINSDGTFTLWTFEENDGAIIGRHRVRVACYDESNMGNSEEEETTTGGMLIPRWYAYIQSSGLEYQVEKKLEGETNHFEIVLNDTRPSM